MMGGADMLRLLHASLTTARLAVLLFVFWRLAQSWRIALLCLAAAMSLDFLTWSVFRPQTFGQLGFALLLLPLIAADDLAPCMLAIPAMMVLWANGHGSYVVAFVMLGAVLAGRIIETIVEKRAPWKDAASLRLAAVIAVSLLGIGLLNPYGFEFYSRTLQFAAHPSLQGGVGEWKPLAFLWGWGHDSDAGLHWIFIASLTVIVMTQLASTKAIPPHRLIVLVLFGLGLSLQQRFAIWWAMLVPWVLVPQWAELAKYWPAQWTPAASVPSFRKTAIAAMLLFPCFMWSVLGGWAVTGGPTPLGPSASDPNQPFSLSLGTPWELAREVARARLDHGAVGRKRWPRSFAAITPAAASQAPSWPRRCRAIT